MSRFDDYLLDAEALIDAASQHGGPLFLMGHSMGGAVAALYAVERLPASRHDVAGLILSSPALAPGRDVPRWMIAASRVMSRVWPRFPAMKIDAALLSRDPAVVEANRCDPLVHHGAIPARTGAEILAAMERIERGRVGLRLPVLVYHGTRDKLTEPEGSRDFGSHVARPTRRSRSTKQLPRNDERPGPRSRDRSVDRLDSGAELRHFASCFAPFHFTTAAPAFR